MWVCVNDSLRKKKSASKILKNFNKRDMVEKCL